MSDARKIILEFPSLRVFLAEYGARISTEGMLLGGEATPAEGLQVEVDVRLRDGMRLLRARGETIGRRSTAGGGARGTAVRFAEVDEASRKLIAKIVDQRRREGAAPFDLGALQRPRAARLRDLAVPASKAFAEVAVGASDGGGGVFDLTAAPAPRQPAVVVAEPETPAPEASPVEDAGWQLDPVDERASEAVTEGAETEQAAVLAAKPDADLSSLFGGDTPESEPHGGLTEAFPSSFVDEVEAELEAVEVPETSFGDVDTSDLEVPPAPRGAMTASVAKPAPPPAAPRETPAGEREPQPVAPPAPPSPVEVTPPPPATEPAPPAAPEPPPAADEPAPPAAAAPSPPAAEPVATVVSEPPPAPAPEPPAAADTTSAPEPPPPPEPVPPAEPVSPTEPMPPAAVEPPPIAPGPASPGGAVTVEIPVPAPRPRVAAPPVVPADGDLLSVPELSSAAAAAAAAEPAEPAEVLPSSAEALRGAAGRSRHVGTWMLIILLAAALAVAGYLLFDLLETPPAPPAVEPPAVAGEPGAGEATPAPGGAATDPGAAEPAGAAPPVAPEEPTTSVQEPPAGVVAPAEVPAESAAEPEPAVPFSGLDRITWSESGDETLLALAGDGEIARRQIEVVRIAGGAPRLIVKLSGVSRPFQPAVLEVETSQVRRVRTGLHAGGELHVVVDLADPAVEMRELSARGSRVEIRLGQGGE